MNAFGVGEVEIKRKVLGQLLLEADVRRVDARVLVIATEDAYTRKAREGVGDGAGRAEPVDSRA